MASSASAPLLWITPSGLSILVRLTTVPPKESHRCTELVRRHTGSVSQQQKSTPTYVASPSSPHDPLVRSSALASHAGVIVVAGASRCRYRVLTLESRGRCPAIPTRRQQRTNARAAGWIHAGGCVTGTAP